MTRHVQVTRLRPTAREEYLRLHEDVWPEVEEALRRHGFRDYSIWLVGDLLIGTYDYIGDDLAADGVELAADAHVQRWWELTDPCQDALPQVTDGSIWAEAREIWRLS
jgi:L-rhamnose mutarotase